jgi:hypothetical protein
MNDITIIELNEDQVEALETRLNDFDEKYIPYKLDDTYWSKNRGYHSWWN